MIDPNVIVMLVSLLAAGAVAGVTTGLFGVGGGFIIVPTLIAILPIFTGEYEAMVHTAVGTSLASIIVSSMRAVQIHRKKWSGRFQRAESLGAMACLRRLRWHLARLKDGLSDADSRLRHRGVGVFGVLYIPPIL